MKHLNIYDITVTLTDLVNLGIKETSFVLFTIFLKLKLELLSSDPLIARSHSVSIESNFSYSYRRSTG